jgi:hypothetical protein
MSLSSSRVRRILVTLLDAGAIVAGSAALVILLGGGTRLTVAGLHLSLRGPVNALLVCAGLAAVRLLIGRRDGLFPSLPRPNPDRIDVERRRFAAPEPATPRVWAFALATFLGSLVWIAPHLSDLRQVPDPGDPLFSAWRIARLAYQLSHDPARLLDGNIFYPLPLTLTYSDSTFLQGIIGTPFILAGVDALLVANALTLFAFPACGLAFFFAGWRLTADPRAALVCGLLGAWYPFHAEHYSHLELHWVMFVPLAIIASLRLLAAPGWRTGLVFGLTVAAQWLASMYLGVMLMSFLAPFIAVAWIAWRVRPSLRLAAAWATAGAVVLPAVIGLGLPYMKTRDARGDRGLQEVWDGSALPSDYADTHIRMTSDVWHLWHSREGNRNERELFPGLSTLALAAAGLMPPLTGAGIATTVAGAITFDWSLGFNGLTYDDLYKRSVVHRGMRVPARFSVVVGAALALLAAFGARRVLRLGRTPTTQGAICAAMALLVLFDLQFDPRLQPYFGSIPSIYARVTPDMVLAEFPREHDTDYMYFATRHQAHLLGGYSGFVPNQPDLWKAFDALPSPAGVDGLRRLGATHLTYNCRLERRERSCEWIVQQLDENPALELVASERWEKADVRLYRLR